MKKLVLALAAVGCLSVPASAAPLSDTPITLAQYGGGYGNDRDRVYRGDSDRGRSYSYDRDRGSSYDRGSRRDYDDYQTRRSYRSYRYRDDYR